VTVSGRFGGYFTSALLPVRNKKEGLQVRRLDFSTLLKGRVQTLQSKVMYKDTSSRYVKPEVFNSLNNDLLLTQ
jgi:hypothetical protein